MNIWTITGNLGKDCEVKTTQSGMTICSFSVAVKSGYGDNAKTTWAMCTLFGKRAEGGLPQYLVKGAQVCIAGEAYLDEWDKDGVTQKMLKVNVDKLDLIGGNANNAGTQAPQAAPQQMAPQQQRPVTMANPQNGQVMQQAPTMAQQQQPVQQAPQPVQGFDNFDDDIPF